MRRVCRLQQAFLLIRARSAHITCSLFTIHYSLLTIPCSLKYQPCLWTGNGKLPQKE